MASKSLSFLLILCAIIVVSPMAKSQLDTSRLIRVQGTVFCSTNGNIGKNDTSIPIFPNATVQLRCGSTTVVSSEVTNRSGEFSILLDPIEFLVSSLLNNCNLVVNTPLSNCDLSLPSFGSLISPLRLVGNRPLGIYNIAIVVPAGFQFRSSN